MMRLDARRPLLVLIGAWNPAIFQPDWIARYIFGFDIGRSFNVMLIQSMLDGRQLFVIEDTNVGYLVSNERFELFAIQFDRISFENLAKFAARLIDTLPHTPLGDFGFNFYFEETEPNVEIFDKLQSNDGIDQQYELISQDFVASMKYDSSCNLNFKRSSLPGRVAFELNYHHFYKEPGAHSVITADRIETLLRSSTEKIKTLYNIAEHEKLCFDVPILANREQTRE